MRSPPLLRYFPHYQHTTVVCGGGGLNKYQARAGDGVQRPLRDRFPPRLKRGVRPQGITTPYTPKSTPCAIIGVACAVCPPRRRPWANTSKSSLGKNPTGMV